MKLKLILLLGTFFVATPLLIGQSLPDIPTTSPLPTPSELSTFNVQRSTLGGTSLPSSIPSNLPSSLPTSIPANLLQQSGLDTSSLTQDPRAQASALRDRYKQGLLDDHRLPSLPTLPATDQGPALAKRFAEQTFPEEFQASKGLLSLPEAAPSNFPTSLPSIIPSSLPSSLPTIIPSSSIPPTPSELSTFNAISSGVERPRSTPSLP